VQIPAAPVANALHAPLFAAARAGKRIVAAGEHGVVLLSDDEGKTFRQARSVPTQSLLTALSFADERQGWASGHDGLVLHTADGGETWAIQREDLDGDRPLLSIYFKDARHGIAVGLFGSAVQTEDGGKTWKPLAVETGEDTDHHLYAIFGDPATALCIAAEAGLIYRSTDGGASWTEIKTANAGSFWTGLRLEDGTLLAAGQRGHVFLSRDQGASWSEVPSGTDQSLTAATQNADGSLLLAGLAGTTLSSGDGGRTLSAHTRGDRVPLYAILPVTGNIPLLFGEKGLSGNQP
jgi:photosystem II stability/assembly factor-like uncharacterized protein